VAFQSLVDQANLQSAVMLLKTAQAAQAALPQRLNFLQTAVLIGSAGSLGKLKPPLLLLLLLLLSMSCWH
jgi:hypothetical protein